MLTTTVGGRTWQYSYSIGRNAAAGNGFTQPVAVAVATGDVLYVISRGQEGAGGITLPNKRIGKLTMNEEFLGDFAGADFTWPAGLTVDREDNLFCSDEYGNFIAKYNDDGEQIDKWGEFGSKPGQLNGPSGLASDCEDNIYVVDSKNERIQKFSLTGEFLYSWGSPGTEQGQFNRPWGITLDKQGNVYVADWGNDRVQKFSDTGTFLRSFGTSKEEGGDLNHPSDVAVDSEGDVYVVDWGNKRVQIYDPEANIITALHGDAQEFSKWANEVVQSNPDALRAYRRVKDRTPLGLFERPVGIAIADQDRIIITETTRGRLQVYQKESGYMDPQFNL